MATGDPHLPFFDEATVTLQNATRSFGLRINGRAVISPVFSMFEPSVTSYYV